MVNIIISFSNCNIN